MLTTDKRKVFIYQKKIVNLFFFIQYYRKSGTELYNSTNRRR